MVFGYDAPASNYCGTFAYIYNICTYTTSTINFVDSHALIGAIRVWHYVPPSRKVH